ncbi:MAG: lipoyl(octanoyl) transferase LipB [Anaerolineales bacterium]
MSEQRVCELHRLGTVDFLSARVAQENLARLIAAGRRPPALILLEHPHTFTFGRRGKSENLLWNEGELADRRVEVHWTDRGGDVTYHGPGQLVGYPVLPIGRLEVDGQLPTGDFVGYLRDLERVLIRALATLGLTTGPREGHTGVWVQPDVASRCKHCPPAARKRPSKLASIGVRVTAQGVSQHGFALNVSPDMQYWEGIVACDLPEIPMVSLADLLDPFPSMEHVTEAVVTEFGNVFQLTMVEAIAA